MSKAAVSLEKVFSITRRSDLAAQLGITAQAISQWRRIPAERVIDVERVTGVSREQLRPDLYPPPVSSADK